LPLVPPFGNPARSTQPPPRGSRPAGPPCGEGLWVPSLCCPIVLFPRSVSPAMLTSPGGASPSQSGGRLGGARSARGRVSYRPDPCQLATQEGRAGGKAGVPAPGPLGSGGLRGRPPGRPCLRGFLPPLLRDSHRRSQTLPFQQLQVLLTLFSESFSSVPRGTCLLSVSRPYLALGGVYHPHSGCTLKQPDSMGPGPFWVDTVPLYGGAVNGAVTLFRSPFQANLALCTVPPWARPLLDYNSPQLCLAPPRASPRRPSCW